MTTIKPTSSSSFADWLEEQRDTASEALSEFQTEASNLSIFTQLSTIQNNLTNQLQELSGNLPEAGPLSAAFRQRATYAIYLLLASIAFGLLAVFVGLPTLLFRPAKFVLCKGFIT